MSEARYIETTCKTAINRVRGGMPFAWSLNPYRGCRHACSSYPSSLERRGNLL